ncbi:hypothetical protein ACH4U6_35250 [Streptomyces netropsis]|uniref:hypothetical protein n=1 Tax=Streptomyces netropsis TaxID=55404 RepID=UPI00379DD06E
MFDTEEELYDAVKSLNAHAREYASARARFAAYYSTYDRGNSAQNIVHEFFAHWVR